MTPFKTFPSFVACALLLAGVASASAAADRASVVLPPEIAKLKPSDHPGYRLATQKCGTCHSADYIDQQPPAFTQAQWTAEVAKMKKAYGAPLDDNDIEQIGGYLATVYGKASSVAPMTSTTPTTPTTPAAATDVAALLSDNGCLACHAADRTIFGPAYHDVAMRYRSDANAVELLAASIRDGSTGKWGPAGMPPFASLGTANAKALAAYVLKQ